MASEKVYHYVWSTFADTILEESKPILKDGTAEEKESRAWLLYAILHDSLITLHPFMPFVTEELWSLIPKSQDRLLLVEPWVI